jgi:hypothetical protein
MLWIDAHLDAHTHHTSDSSLRGNAHGIGRIAATLARIADAASLR